MPALLAAPPPHPTFSRSALILVLGLIVMLVLFTGLHWLIRFGRRVLAQRRGALTVDVEMSLAAGGVVPGPWVKSSKKKALATVSPAQVLEKAREATPAPLLKPAARVNCASILAHRAHIQGHDVAPGRLVVRKAHASPGPTPLRAVHTSEAESVASLIEDSSVKHAQGALAFSHLFVSSFEDDEDEDTDEDEDAELDVTFWIPCGDGARPALPLPEIKALKALAPTYVKGTTPRKSSRAIVQYAAGPLRGTTYNRISTAPKPSPKLQALDGKENRPSSVSRIPRRVY
ncbi:hypothetical protein C8R47DRAFT_444092 [Mycena vitilis]|nr:hypothetical protein C8R47DRAFT_444092 [Mycena vitilis]